MFPCRVNLSTVKKRLYLLQKVDKSTLRVKYSYFTYANPNHPNQIQTIKKSISPRQSLTLFSFGFVFYFVVKQKRKGMKKFKPNTS